MNSVINFFSSIETYSFKSKVRIHPVKFVMFTNRKMQLRTPFLKIQVKVLVTITSLLIFPKLDFWRATQNF